MAGKADGTIYINTAIETDGFVAGGKDIEAAVRRMVKSVSDIGDTAKISLQKQAVAFVKQNQMLAQQEKKVDSLKTKWEEMKNQKVATDEYKTVNKEIDNLEKSLDRAIEKQIKFVETGGNQKNRSFAQMEYDIEQINQKLEAAKQRKQALESSGGAYQAVNVSEIEQKYLSEREKLIQMNNALGTSYESLKAKVESYVGTTNNLTGIKARLISFFESLRGKAQSTSTSMSTLSKSTKKTDSSLKGSLKNILKYGLGIRSLFVLINKLRTALVKGFQNLAQYSGPVNTNISSMMSALTQLKNSLATAFSPILSVIAPIITSFCNMLSRVITYIGMFFAALTGSGTFTKAKKVQQDYASSVSGAASATKDEADATKDAAEAADAYLGPLDTINKYQSNKKDDASKAPSSSDGGGLSAGDMFETVPIESKFKDLAKKVKEMMAPLYEAWDLYGDSIKKTLGKIGNDFKSFFFRIGQATYDWAVNLDWKPLFSSVDTALKKFEPLVDLILNGMAWAYENVLLPLAKWTLEKGAPALVELLGDAFDYLRSVLMALQPLFEWLWNNALLPLAQTVTDVALGIITAFDGVLVFLSGVFSGDWGKIFEGASKIAEGFQMIVDSVFGFIQNNLLIPFDKFLQGVFATDWANAFGAIGNVLNGFFAGTQAVWNGVRALLEGIMKFIKGVFHGDWKMAWEGIKETFGGAFGGIIGIAKTVVNTVIGIINGMISLIESGLNGLIGMVNSVTSKIPSKILADKVHITPVSFSRIPYLATGAVIPPNAPFMAVLGDQRQGNNIETPEALLRKIVREETGKNNSGSTYRFTGQINRRVLFDEFITEAKLRQQASGKNPLLLGG